MKIKIILLFFALTSHLSASAQDWFCSKGSSRRNGNIFEVCGLGENKSEVISIKKALKSAFKEFDLICNQFDDCKKKFKDVTPMRIDCDWMDDKIKCYRSFAIEVNPARSISAKSSHQPCNSILKACIAAGYIKRNAPFGKGAYKFCMNPILAGGKPDDVYVEQEDINACRIFVSERFVNHPCKNIAQACTTAGYGERGVKLGKGIFKNCIKPVLEGQFLAGVNVVQDDVAACRAIKLR